MKIAEILGGIFIIFGVISIISGWIAIALRRIVCGEKRICVKDKCPFHARGICDWAKPSPQEIEDLKKLLSEMQTDPDAKKQ